MGANFREGTWEIFGESNYSRSFVVEFKGYEATVARRCEKSLASLRKNKKEWHTLQAADEDGDSQQLSISADKSCRQVRAEM
eukprot:3651646-Karenia_brevis.AAC.1